MIKINEIIMQIFGDFYFYEHNSNSLSKFIPYFLYPICFYNIYFVLYIK